uniref:Aldehyde dehydrogenase n=1 Tax=Rhabditophanes sp. KR3021 TaxID=114890 RepID=A0AC35TXW7_9BILA
MIANEVKSAKKNFKNLIKAMKLKLSATEQESFKKDRLLETLIQEIYIKDSRTVNRSLTLASITPIPPKDYVCKKNDPCVTVVGSFGKVEATFAGCASMITDFDASIDIPVMER